MELTLYKRIGSGPYKPATLEEIYAIPDNVLLIQDDSERPLVEGLQILMGNPVVIKLYEPAVFMNPWVHNRPQIFFSFDPLTIGSRLDTTQSFI